MIIIKFIIILLFNHFNTSKSIKPLRRKGLLCVRKYEKKFIIEVQEHEKRMKETEDNG